MRRLSPHFTLEELVPAHMAEADVPNDVLTNLEMLAVNILEPLRLGLCVPLRIHDGWRPVAYNARTPGSAQHSDHIAGNACDCNSDPMATRTWEAATIFAFHWVRTQMEGRFGQLILEDHREALGNPAKLWLHVANPTKRHPGTTVDDNRILLSFRPKQYVAYRAALVAAA